MDHEIDEAINIILNTTKLENILDATSKLISALNKYGNHTKKINQLIDFLESHDSSSKSEVLIEVSKNRKKISEKLFLLEKSFNCLKNITDTDDIRYRVFRDIVIELIKLKKYKKAYDYCEIMAYNHILPAFYLNNIYLKNLGIRTEVIDSIEKIIQEFISHDKEELAQKTRELMHIHYELDSVFKWIDDLIGKNELKKVNKLLKEIKIKIDLLPDFNEISDFTTEKTVSKPYFLIELAIRFFDINQLEKSYDQLILAESIIIELSALAIRLNSPIITYAEFSFEFNLSQIAILYLKLNKKSKTLSILKKITVKKYLSHEIIMQLQKEDSDLIIKIADEEGVYDSILNKFSMNELLKLFLNNNNIKFNESISKKFLTEIFEENEEYRFLSSYSLSRTSIINFLFYVAKKECFVEKKPNMNLLSKFDELIDIEDWLSFLEIKFK